MEPEPKPPPQMSRWARSARMAPYVLGVVAALSTSVAMGRHDEASRRWFGVTPSLLGEPLPSGSDAPAKARALLLAYLRRPLVVTVGELGALDQTVRVTTTAEALGARIDEPRFDALLRDVRDPHSALMRNAGGSLPLPLPIRLEPKGAFDAVVALKEDLDKSPEDAKLDLDARKVIPEVVGRRVDVYATMAVLDEALRRGETVVRAAFVLVSPELTQEKLGNVDLTDTLGYFETKYATDRKHVDRTFNLRLAASRLNGKVIMPGETFDFNQVVGPRDEAHGYRVAKVIADGELVDGMGGGTCQVAGTLHGAALFSGLDIVHRTPHTRPSYYIKMGLDAAVAYPAITLKLRNPFPFPVVLKETVVGGVVRAEILGPKRSRVVTFIRKIDEVTPFPEREVKDDHLPDGKRVLTQRGIPGFKVRRYRIVREGPVAVREKTEDVYPPTMQIWHVGTGVDVGKSKANEDDHPEYVADVYLAITQGPGVGKPDAHEAHDEELHAGPIASGMEEVRIPGETGTKGWSKKYTSSGGASSAASAHAIDEHAISMSDAEKPSDPGDHGDPGDTCDTDPCKPVAKKSAHAKRHKK